LPRAARGPNIHALKEASMPLLKHAIDIVLHLDKYLSGITQEYGIWIYLILFLIIFCETGLVVTPFLPGDSLLFAVGALAAGPERPLSLVICLGLLSIAAIGGDALNYYIGYLLGPRLAQKGHLRFIKKEHLDRTHQFYEKYGKMTIILARFVPIVRTFAPFVAGVGSMRYIAFATYNVIGGVAWIFLLTLAGYFFGNIPLVKKNFSAVIMAIIIISILPIVFEYWRHRREKK
jgi:membrane-associated protein